MNEPATPPPNPHNPHQIPVEYGRPLKKRLTAPMVLTILAVTLVLAIIGSVIAWQDMKKFVLRKQALSYLKKADAALKAEEWQEASENYSKAYLKANQEPEVIRGIARFMQKTGSDPERTLTFWHQLEQVSTPTVEDKVDIAQTYVTLQKASEARKVMNTIPAEERNDADVLEVEAGVLNIEGRTAEAATTLRHAMRLNPNDPESQLKLALLDLRNPLTEVQQSAIDSLWNLAKGNDPKSSLAAIDIIARQTKASKDQFQQMLELLKNNPEAEPRHRYSILSPMLTRFPEMREAIYKEEDAKLSDASAMDMALYFMLLQSLGEHEKVLQLIPQNRTFKQRELLSVYLESLAATNQWATLRRQLQSAASLPLAPTELSLINARIAKGLGEADDIIRNHLADAASFATASRDIRTVRRVSAIADSMGYPRAALDALRSGANLPQHRVSLLEAILNIQTDQQDSEGMLETLTDLIKTDTTLHYHQEKQIYLKLLLGSELELVPTQLSNPEVTAPLPPHSLKLLNALSAFRHQNIEDLRNALTDLTPDHFQPGQRAVLSGLLNISGDPRRAFEIAEKIPASLLLEEEKRFLRRAL